MAAEAAGSPVDKAKALRKAMEGWGTDEAGLINVIANLAPKEIRLVTEAYAKVIKRNLVEDIKSETGGHFEDALLAMLTPVIEYDATLLYKAMKGLGTNEQIVIEVICTRYPAEIKALADEYKRIYAHDLEEDLSGELSGDFKKVILHRLKATEEKGDINSDVEHLYKAGQGKIGTDEAVFINIIAHRSKEYLAQLNTAYANKHGKSLSAVIDSEMSGNLKKSLIAIVTPPAEYFADRLYHAMKGAGTDDAALIRIIASQRFRTLRDMCAIYLNRHSVSLKKAVADELSGDYKKLIVAVVERISEGKIPDVQ